MISKFLRDHESRFQRAITPHIYSVNTTWYANHANSYCLVEFARTDDADWPDRITFIARTTRTWTNLLEPIVDLCTRAAAAPTGQPAVGNTEGPQRPD